MLNQIKTSKPAPSAEGAVSLLVACHERIRHFSSAAAKLAQSEGASPQEIAASAVAVHRYFTVALPLHEADENESLHPRLQRLVPPGFPVRAASDAMVRQHEAIDEVLERLVPLLVVLMNNPAKVGEVSSEMRQLTGRLTELFTEHLKLEEESIFPVMAGHLGEAEMAAMLGEMKARRAE